MAKKHRRKLSGAEIFGITERMKPLILDLHILVKKPGLTKLEENYMVLLYRIVRLYTYDLYEVDELLNTEFLTKLYKIKGFAQKSSYHPTKDEKEMVEDMIRKLEIDVPTDIDNNRLN